MAALPSSLRPLRHLISPRRLAGPQWQQAAWRQRGPSRFCIRALATESSAGSPDVLPGSLREPVVIPYHGITHARTVPATPSYFSREPHFNDLHIRISKLLAKYHYLPTVSGADAPLVPWIRLREMRSRLGEPIKASHYARVMRSAKRLNCIEPNLVPPEIRLALQDFTRDINPFLNRPKPIAIDKYGRAVGVGKRKEATARAFVVEGTGEVLVNGKTLDKAFGRVHDRESAVWALTATQRLDKYNVWALVEGGGTTGQAEALTQAVAKALVAHEPALKTALRRAGCITRDPRAVERKKHGHLKARKKPAWVKR